MAHRIDDVRIQELKQLVSPSQLMEEIPVDDEAFKTIVQARESASRVVSGDDDRLLVVVGPCSIHDPAAALEYADLLKAYADQHKEDLLIIMRVYFEKPRTSVGWKGLINDPNLDDSFDINKGLRMARDLLVKLADKGMPTATEFLDVISPQFVADLISWGAIGARTTESQVHRELASGLSMPIGFKNATDGNIKAAIDAVTAASRPHHFLSVTKDSKAAIVSTLGNRACHIILRGSNQGTNYDEQSIIDSVKMLTENKLLPRLMVDCSHGNSGKDHTRQQIVAKSICQQIKSGSKLICGVMLESHLKAGKQALAPGKKLVYGQSITDACIDWDETVDVLDQLALAVKQRREAAGDDEALSIIRRKIDAIDRNIESLISDRAQQALQVATIKKQHSDHPVFYRPEREAAILEKIKARNQSPIDDDAMANIFKMIMSECLAIQTEDDKK